MLTFSCVWNDGDMRDGVLQEGSTLCDGYSTLNIIITGTLFSDIVLSLLEDFMSYELHKSRKNIQ